MKYEAHPLADRFPMLDDEALERLAQDIKENGLQHPIILDGENRVLDGRNRLAACELAGVEPVTELFMGDDPAAFVLSVNVERRHLTTGQQAMSTALVLSDAGKRENGRWKRGSINQNSDLSRGFQVALANAGHVLDHAPDLAEKVVNGDIALDAAYREAEDRHVRHLAEVQEVERMQAEEEAAKEHLQNVAPHYLEQYDTATVALAAWETDNREKAAARRLAQQEAERKARETYEAYADTYRKITQNVAGLYGLAHVDINKFFEHYQTGMLLKNQVRLFTPETFRAAAKAAHKIADWIENNA